MATKSLLSQIISVLCSPVWDKQAKHPELKGTMFSDLKKHTGAHINIGSMLRWFGNFFFLRLLLTIMDSNNPRPLWFPSCSFILSTSSLFHTHSHLCWGGVLYFINSGLHAKIHYANLLFSRTQACQLTCGTNFCRPPLPSSPFPPSLSSPTPANKYV